MYRSFISWRYFHSRRTNLIGVVGIFVAVAALILILSIMTGFLEESRRTVRGSLSDLVIEPSGLARPDGVRLPEDPAAILAVLRADGRVAAASPRLAYYGLLTVPREGADLTEAMLSSSQFGHYSGVQLVGIDVVPPERRCALAGLRLGLLGVLGFAPRFEVQDELDTTRFGEFLVREGSGQGLWTPRVADPADPFAPPPGYEPEGRLPASVVVGEQLARIFGLERGSVVGVLTGGADPETGEIRELNREFVVAGTFRSGENEIDSGRIYLERSELADFLGRERGYSEILVRLADYDRHGAAVRDDLRRELDERGLIRGGAYADYEVKTWEDFRRSLLGAIENERVLMAIMLSLVLVVAGFTVFAILSMMVTEKRRDIGILCALGATHGGVRTLFLMIALWDALIGASLGAVAGVWGALEIDAFERWLSRTIGVEIFDRSVYLFDHIPTQVDPVAVAAIVSGALVCTLVFAYLPAWRASRLDPLDALRYE